MVVDLKLFREPGQPFGFRLIGGRDFEIPLTVSRVCNATKKCSLIVVTIKLVIDYLDTLRIYKCIIQSFIIFIFGIAPGTRAFHYIIFEILLWGRNFVD